MNVLGVDGGDCTPFIYLISFTKCMVFVMSSIQQMLSERWVRFLNALGAQECAREKLYALRERERELLRAAPRRAPWAHSAPGCGETPEEDLCPSHQDRKRTQLAEDPAGELDRQRLWGHVHSVDEKSQSQRVLGRERDAIGLPPPTHTQISLWLQCGAQNCCGLAGVMARPVEMG